jgi:Copper transport outer membrane protein, MctB
VFDFRYHVASLAAVFVALIIGILVGVGLSGQGFVTDSERERLEGDKAELEGQLEAERNRADALERGQQAGADFAEDAYPVLAADRLRGQQISLVVIGSLGDTDAVEAVRNAVDDAGGRLVRTYALRVPLDPAAVQETLRRRTELAGYVGRNHLDDVGRDIGRELVEQGPTPLLDALADQLVEERSGPSDVGADGVVVVRTAAPQMGATADFVNGLYSGLASAGVPAVGAETRDALPSAVPAFSRGRLSTVDDVDTPSGRLALVLLLAGAEPGHYGRHEDTAADGLLPPIEELPDEPGDGGG